VFAGGARIPVVVATAFLPSTFVSTVFFPDRSPFFVVFCFLCMVSFLFFVFFLLFFLVFFVLFVFFCVFFFIVSFVFLFYLSRSF